MNETQSSSRRRTNLPGLLAVLAGCILLAYFLCPCTCVRASAESERGLVEALLEQTSASMEDCSARQGSSPASVTDLLANSYLTNVPETHLQRLVIDPSLSEEPRAWRAAYAWPEDCQDYDGQNAGLVMMARVSGDIRHLDHEDPNDALMMRSIRQLVEETSGR